VLFFFAFAAAAQSAFSRCMPASVPQKACESREKNPRAARPVPGQKVTVQALFLFFHNGAAAGEGGQLCPTNPCRLPSAPKSAGKKHRPEGRRPAPGSAPGGLCSDSIPQAP